MDAPEYTLPCRRRRLSRICRRGWPPAGHAHVRELPQGHPTRPILDWIRPLLLGGPQSACDSAPPWGCAAMGVRRHGGAPQCDGGARLPDLSRTADGPVQKYTIRPNGPASPLRDVASGHATGRRPAPGVENPHGSDHQQDGPAFTRRAGARGCYRVRHAAIRISALHGAPCRPRRPRPCIPRALCMVRVGARPAGAPAAGERGRVTVTRRRSAGRSAGRSSSVS